MNTLLRGLMQFSLWSVGFIFSLCALGVSVVLLYMYLYGTVHVQGSHPLLGLIAFVFMASFSVYVHWGESLKNQGIFGAYLLARDWLINEKKEAVSIVILFLLKNFRFFWIPVIMKHFKQK